MLYYPFRIIFGSYCSSLKLYKGPRQGVVGVIVWVGASPQETRVVNNYLFLSYA